MGVAKIANEGIIRKTFVKEGFCFKDIQFFQIYKHH